MADEQNAAQDLASLWVTNYARYRQSRDLIAECGRWERQEVKPSLPTRLVNGAQIPQGFAVTMPHATTMGQDVAAFVSRREPSIKRVPLGEGSRAERDASQVETWLQEAFASKVLIDGEALYPTLCAFGTHDAEYAVMVMPATSHYSGMLNLYEDDGKTILAKWRRDEEGQTSDEYAAKNGGKTKGYRVNVGKSTRAQLAYAKDFKARRWPMVVRVLSAPEYLPLGRNPLTGKLDTLLIRTVCSASHLKAEGFDVWASSTGGGEGRGREGSGQSYTLYELHTSKPWRIIYQVTGLEGQQYQATKDGTPVQQGIDMGAEYKLDSLLAGQFWGWHRAHEKDPAKRGIPLLAPFLGVLGGSNRSITGIVEHLHQTGYGGWGIEMNPEMYQTWVEMERPTQFDLQDNSIHVLLGKPVSLVHEGAGADAWRVLELLMGLVNQFNEGEKVRSSPDASSIAQTTALASVDTVLSQISNGALMAYKFVAESLLELCSVLSEQTGAPIPVYCHVNKDGNEQTHVELGADQLMGDFTVEVEQPTKKGSNLPKAQAGIAWAESGYIGKAEWREDFYGDPQPERALDIIAAERYIDGDDGQKELSVLVARLQGDREALRIKGLQDKGQLTVGGTPTAALPARPVGGGAASGVAPNGVPLPQQPNQAASALGGSMAAALNPGAQTQVVQATGTGAETAAP